MGKADAYFEKDHHFKDGIIFLRKLALQTELEETVKWGAPVYTIGGKNVLGIMSFKNHFGLWFFNGVFLSDPKSVLENAQAGKTKAMRHWKFSAIDEINPTDVLGYIQEAIENQKKGLMVRPGRKQSAKIPSLLKIELEQNEYLKKQFQGLSAYKQSEFCEYIESAKQEKTKISRMKKILPMIQQGIGINDKYRKS
ncbi:MAG: DUF1801 domain-containing protein [Flavobacteriaceae bacterium]